MHSLISIVNKLKQFWRTKCQTIELFPYDCPVGAATFHPQSFFNTIANKEMNMMYVNLCRRNSDGCYAQSPNRLLIHHQFQVMISPSPVNILDLYLESLEYIGLSQKNNSILLIDNNWNSASLGAQGYGWEVTVNAMEVTQFTYFQKMADIELKLCPVELAYGLERLVVALNCQDIFQSEWDENFGYKWRRNEEEELSSYYLKERKIPNFNEKCDQIQILLEKNLSIPAYQELMEANDIFNTLDAQNCLDQYQRQDYINLLKHLSKSIAHIYLQNH